MGIFDNLANLSPEQTQGLLAFASSALQSGGSGRPVSFGGALGGGIQAFQQSMDSQKKLKMEQEQAAQIAQLTGLKIRDAESDLTNQQAMRDRAEGLRQFYMKQASGGAGGMGGMPAANMGGEVFASAASAYGLPSDNEGLNKIVGLVNQGMTPTQAAASLAGKSAPTVENSQMMQGAMQAPQGQTTPTKKTSLYEQRLAQAEALRNAGYGPEADAAEATALKFMPQVDSWESVRVQGKIFKKPYFKDGTSGEYIPAEVAEKLMKVDTGGKTLLTGEMSGNTYQSFNNTVDPNTSANIASAAAGRAQSASQFNQRLDLDRQVASQRAMVEKAPTEFQGKSAAFGLRADEANKKLGELEGKYSPAKINSKQAVGNTWLVGGALEAATNYALSPQDQQAEQAQRDFVNAVLRQESGAAIGASEFKNAQRQYFPQPNDGPEVIAQKARDRALSVQALQANAGRAKLTANDASASGSQPARKSVLKGQVIDGYRFKGGEMGDKNNWEKI